jgi:ceramide glucosyltransferase
MLRFLGGFALLATAAGLAYTALAIAHTRRFRERVSRKRVPLTIPASVLKPLHGDEPDLYANLSSFCEQVYPEYQVIFGAANANDSALDVARRVQREHPHCDIEIVAGDAKRARNPKVGNLLGMIDHAKHPLIVIADSDMRVGSDYLEAVASSFADERTGAATCIYGGTPNGTVASQLGAMFVNDQFSPSVLVAQSLEPLTYCFGATMAIRSDVLERIGGLHALADHLGDDYMLGNLVARAGYRVALCPYVVHTGVTERDLRSLWLHEVRWARTIRTARPAGYAGSILTYAMPFAALFAVASRRPLAGAAVVALAVTLRLLLHEEARKTFAPHIRAVPWLVPVRDFLSVGVWCASFLGRGITWRGGGYHVYGDGRMVASPNKCNDSV